MRDDSIHESYLVRPLRREGVTGQKIFEGTLPPRQARQPLGSTKRRCDADIDLWFREAGAVARDREMNGLDDLAAASKAIPLTAAMIGF